MANTIFYIHMAIMIYILFGAFIIPSKYLHYYIILIILVFLDWNDIDGMCTFTKLEYYFRYGIWITRKEEAQELEEPIEFFRPLLHTIFGIEDENHHLTPQMSSRINYFLFAFLLLIAFIRFLRYCKK